jgi:hypothetical protein
VDYPWLQYCLRSIHQYATGFRKIWIVSPEHPAGLGRDAVCVSIPTGTIPAEWKVMNEESSDGYLSQQIHKLYADTITNYEADYILFGDSDTLFTRRVTPQDFFAENKPIWYCTPYEMTDTPWKSITEKFMGREVKYEFMRRHPFMVPKWLLSGLREFCWATHQLILSDYIKKQPHREFSEFNALGAYAWEFHRDKFQWINTVKAEIDPPFVRQFFSWGGLTEEVKAEIQTILSGSGLSGGQEVSDVIPGLPSAAQNNSVPNFQGFGEVKGDVYESPGDHIRWLRDYAAVSPSRRQYILQQLEKHKLVKRKGKKSLAKT